MVCSLAILPTVAASASVTKAKSTTTTTTVAHKSTKGTNPNSPVCGAFRSTAGISTKQNAAATTAAKETNSNKWSTAKEGFAYLISHQTSEVQALQETLSNAPKKDKAAVTYLAAQLSKVSALLSTTHSTAEYSVALGKVLQSAKVTKAQATLKAYAIGLCGTSVVLVK